MWNVKANHSLTALFLQESDALLGKLKKLDSIIHVFEK